MGVSDPEQVKAQGRTFTADALRNIIQDPSDRPDLIIHRGLSQSVNIIILFCFQEYIQHCFHLDMEGLGTQIGQEKLVFNFKQITFLIYVINLSGIINPLFLLH